MYVPCELLSDIQAVIYTGWVCELRKEVRTGDTRLNMEKWESWRTVCKIEWLHKIYWGVSKAREEEFEDQVRGILI